MRGVFDSEREMRRTTWKKMIKLTTTLCGIIVKFCCNMRNCRNGFERFWYADDVLSYVILVHTEKMRSAKFLIASIGATRSKFYCRDQLQLLRIRTWREVRFPNHRHIQPAIKFFFFDVGCEEEEEKKSIYSSRVRDHAFPKEMMFRVAQVGRKQ